VLVVCRHAALFECWKARLGVGPRDACARCFPKLFLPRPLRLRLGVGPGDVRAAFLCWKTLEDSRVLTDVFEKFLQVRLGVRPGDARAAFFFV